RHDLSGGNTFLPDILPDIRVAADNVELDTLALAEGKQRAIATLQRAAALDVQSFRQGDTVITRVQITNLTGHKLPTGYPEGRRMWLNIVGMDSSGDTVYQSGAYDSDSGTLSMDNQIKIYQIALGLKPSTATLYGLPPGESFHFSLN